MSLKFLLLGFGAKIITGLDDTITHVPVLASVTRTRMGKVAFSLGTLLAVGLGIVLALFLSSILHLFAFYKYIAAALIFALAIAIYFDLFIHLQRTKTEHRLMAMKFKANHFFPLLGIGFVASVATILDDIVVFTPLLIQGQVLVASVGILLATILEILLVIYFSEKIQRVKYKEEIASLALVILGVLILVEVI